MNASSPEDPIRLEDVSVHFDRKAALDGLTLSFRRGVLTVLIGASGSGKSLALKTGAGLMTPDEGAVFFEGQNIAEMGEEEYRLMQSRTGFHFQDAALWANKSLRENLSLPLLAGNEAMTEADLDARVAEAFDSMGLRLDPMARPATISMGQRKMVSFLRAAISIPEVLFLDEPSTFMDAGGVRYLVSRIEAFRKRGTTIIMATNNRALADRLADDVTVLEDGRLLTRGEYREIMGSEDPELKAVLRELA